MKQRGRQSTGSVVALRAVDGSSPRLAPPSSLNDAEKKIWAAVVAHADHLRQTDTPLLSRYVEVVSLSNHAAEQMRIDHLQGRPACWLGTQERLVKLMITLGRQLRLSPLSRADCDPKTLARSDNGPVSAYETMRLEHGDDP
jgi:phage terminase small subunit